jgi:hypothetical protein
MESHIVEVVGHPLVHGGGWFEEVVREVLFAPIEEIGDRGRETGVGSRVRAGFAEGLTQGLEEVAEGGPGEGRDGGVDVGGFAFGAGPGEVEVVLGEGFVDGLEDVGHFEL